jgi:hypothetical protein
LAAGILGLVTIFWHDWIEMLTGPTGPARRHLFWMGETLVSVTHGRGMYRIDLSGV